MAVLLAYQTATDPLRANLGEIVQAHLLMQVGLQVIFVAYFFINILAVFKNWVMKYLAGEAPVAQQDDLMWDSHSKIADKIEFEGDSSITN